MSEPLMSLGEERESGGRGERERSSGVGEVRRERDEGCEVNRRHSGIQPPLSRPEINLPTPAEGHPAARPGPFSYILMGQFITALPESRPQVSCLSHAFP